MAVYSFTRKRELGLPTHGTQHVIQNVLTSCITVESNNHANTKQELKKLMMEVHESTCFSNLHAFWKHTFICGVNDIVSGMDTETVDIVEFVVKIVNYMENNFKEDYKPSAYDRMLYLILSRQLGVLKTVLIWNQIQIPKGLVSIWINISCTIQPHVLWPGKL